MKTLNERLTDIEAELAKIDPRRWQQHVCSGALPEVVELMRSVTKDEWAEAIRICRAMWIIMKPQLTHTIDDYCAWTWMESWFRVQIKGGFDIGENPAYRKGET